MSDWDFWLIEEVEFVVPGRTRRTLSRTLTPPCNIYETPTHWVIQVEVPGVQKENLSVEILNQMLIIRGVRMDTSNEEERRYYAMEFAFGPFERRIRLPQGLDLEHIESVLDAGILNIRIPKKAPRVIEIESHE